MWPQAVLYVVAIMAATVLAYTPSNNCYFTDDAYGRLTWSLIPNENRTSSYSFSLTSESLEDLCLGVLFISPQDGIEMDVFNTTIMKEKTDAQPKAKYFLYCYHEDSFGDNRWFHPLAFRADDHSLDEKNTTFFFILEQPSTWSFKPVPLYTHFSLGLRATYLNISDMPSGVIFSFFVFPWGDISNDPHRDYYYIKLFDEEGKPNHVWHPECDANYFRTRAVYYIWKMLAFSLNAFLCVIVLLGLISIKNKYYVRSRSIVPYISSALLLIHNIVNIVLSALYAEPTYDTLIMNTVIIVVFSIQIAQIIRYFICRLAYSKVGIRQEKPLWFRILFSRLTPIIVVIVIVIVEGAIFVIVANTTEGNFYFELLDNVVVAFFVILFLVAVIGITIYVVQNRRVLKRLGSIRRIFRWYFYYDDTFRYHGELFVIVLTLLSGLVFWLLSMINGTYFSHKPALPVSYMNMMHIIGYSLYGVSKIVFDTLLVGFEPAYLILISLFERSNSQKQSINDKELLNEIELFLASHVGDLSCMDLMKRYLATEFRSELLDIFLFIRKTTQFDPEAISKEFPSLQVELVFEGEKLDSRCMDLDFWRIQFCDIVQRNMFAAFLRLKHTVIFQKEYVERKEHETEFVLKQIGQ